MSHPVNYKTLFDSEWKVIHSVDERNNRSIVQIVHKKTGVIFDNSSYELTKNPFEDNGSR